MHFRTIIYIPVQKFLLKHFFSVLSFPFSGSPVHSDPFRDLGAHLLREPALRQGLALPLQRLRGKGTESSLSREPPQPPSPAPHQLGALTPYLARSR